MTTQDPVNLYLTNIAIDVYSLYDFVYFLTVCNYPEADTETWVHSENITFLKSSDRTFLLNPTGIGSSAGGNQTIKNIDAREWYVTLNDWTPAFMPFTTPL